MKIFQLNTKSMRSQNANIYLDVIFFFCSEDHFYIISVVFLLCFTEVCCFEIVSLNCFP